MAINSVTLNWTPVITGDVTCQRVSKRKKSVGGAFDTTNFIDVSTYINAACISTAINTLFAVVDWNVVYEFKVENKCNTGAYTINDNGLVEQILFKCLLPTINVVHTDVNLNIPLAGTDITKVKYTIKKQSDSSTFGTQTISRVADNSPATFTGLTALTGYYILIELYANVNGVEVVSSDIDYIGLPCGGNITSYTFSTTTSITLCKSYMNTTPNPVLSTYTDCDDVLIEDAVINPGQSICVHDTVPPTGGLIDTGLLCN